MDFPQARGRLATCLPRSVRPARLRDTCTDSEQTSQSCVLASSFQQLIPFLCLHFPPDRLASCFCHWASQPYQRAGQCLSFMDLIFTYSARVTNHPRHASLLVNRINIHLLSPEFHPRLWSQPAGDCLLRQLLSVGELLHLSFSVRNMG